MYSILHCLVSLWLVKLSSSDPASAFDLNYPNLKNEIYEQPVNFMAPEGKAPHLKAGAIELEDPTPVTQDSWSPFDFSKFDAFLDAHRDDVTQNRVRRMAKRRKGSGKGRASARRSDSRKEENKEKKKKKEKPNYDVYEPTRQRDKGDSRFVEMPKDLYQAHLRPGVIFRIHMSEAILKMQYRNYGEDKDESVIEADVEYLRLTRKVISDEITKFEDLLWLVQWFNNRSGLIQEHTCNTRYFTVGTPPTMFTHTEEYMKRMCLFDNVYLDHIPYVIGDDGSLMAAVAPPVLHCDAATCTSVPFIDSVMFEERLPKSNVRTLTRCQASCRAHCRNDPDCLKKCTDRCFRVE